MLGRLIQSRLALVATSVLVTAIVTGGIAWAASNPVSGGIVHTCYNPSTGSVTLKVNSTCPSTGNKTPLNWSVAGVKGPTGDTGPMGQSPDENVVWTASVPAQAKHDSVVSNTKFGAGATVTGVTGWLAGNFTSCTGGYVISVGVVGAGPEDALYWQHFSPGSVELHLLPTKSTTQNVTSPTVEPLAVDGVSCFNAANQAIASPPITFSATVEWVHPVPSRNIT